MSPVSETDSQPVHWLDNGCACHYNKRSISFGGPTPIKHRSPRWMIKQAEGRSGQSANNQPSKWVLCKWSIMNASKQLYENNAWGESWVTCVCVCFHDPCRINPSHDSKKLEIKGIGFQPQVVVLHYIIGTAGKEREPNTSNKKQKRFTLHRHNHKLCNLCFSFAFFHSYISLLHHGCEWPLCQTASEVALSILYIICNK